MTSLLTLKALLAEGRLNFDQGGYNAVVNDDRDVLTWLLENGWDWKAGSAHRAGTAAASRGNISLLEWMHGQGYGLNPDMWSAAVEGGHDNVLEWLNQKQCPTGDMGRACLQAANLGKEKVIDKLDEYGLPMDMRCYVGAAEGGHISTLQWLYENTGGWNARVRDTVLLVADDDEDIVEWANSIEL